MAVGPTSLSPRRILATGFGAFVVLYVCTAVWAVARSDTQSETETVAPTPPPLSATVEITTEDDTLTITGRVATRSDSDAVRETVLRHSSFPLVVNLLVIDPSIAGGPDLAALAETLDRLPEPG